MRFKKTRRFIIAATLALAALPTNAQDLLARQAPVDRKMKAMDTIVLRNILEREMAGNPLAQLYSEWNNKYAHRATALPDSFRIDLRHFQMPTTSRVITSNFGRRWGRMHKGLDIKVYIGDTIRAAFDGKVRIVQYEAGGYGNYVVIRHNNGLETIYGHMSKHLVKENQTVHAGTPIGLGGNTGRSTGSHLHFETRLCGVALDPALMFDFVNQDVTADFYMFRNHQKNKNARNLTTVKDRNDDEEFSLAEADDALTAEATERTEKQREKTDSNSSVEYHKVARGETLYSISQKHGLTVKQLCKLNGISTRTRIRAGQILKCS